MPTTVRMQSKAIAMVARAIKRGVLVRPAICERCQQPARTEAHHKDYSLPLVVLWLCRRCHRGEHRQYRLGIGVVCHGQ